MSKLSERLRVMANLGVSISVLLECADAAERLERLNAELRNDLQRVDHAYRELQHAGEVRYDRAQAAIAENAALRAACERTKEILDAWGPERRGDTLERLYERITAALAKRGAT